MPTKYKVTRTEKPVSIKTLASLIDAYVGEHADQILSNLMPAGFEFKEDDELDGCGSRAALKT
jgi:hypothetical protein